MRAILAILALVSGLGTGLPATAQASFPACEKSEAEAIFKALKGARIMAGEAMDAVGDTPEYRRWFGPYTEANAHLVRETFKAIHRAMLTAEIVGICGDTSDTACTGVFAFVYPNSDLEVHLCPSYFTMPSMFEYPRGHDAMTNGTREGTIIHEISHFATVASTADNCYSRPVCMSLAQENPRAVVINADSYQYYAEDVSYVLRGR